MHLQTEGEEEDGGGAAVAAASRRIIRRMSGVSLWVIWCTFCMTWQTWSAQPQERLRLQLLVGSPCLNGVGGALAPPQAQAEDGYRYPCFNLRFICEVEGNREMSERYKIPVPEQTVVRADSKIIDAANFFRAPAFLSTYGQDNICNSSAHI